jgi:hypothetical protein
MKKAVWIFAALFMLAGCSTDPVAFSKAKEVKPDNLREAYAKYSQPKEGSARVIVVRDSGVLGSGGRALLTVDGEPIAEFWSGERLELFLPPNNYIFGVQGKLGAISAGPLTEVTGTIKPNRTNAFRISVTYGDSAFKFQPTTQIQ